MEKEKVFTRREMQGILIIVVIVAFITIMISNSIGYNQGRSDVKRSLEYKAEYINMLRDLGTYHTGREAIDSLIMSHEQELVKSIDSAFKAK